MTHQTHKNDTKLKNFDDLWALGDPIAIEQKFRELLPQAKALKDKSIYLQILSQIALTQALQKQFDAAHKTLDKAEGLLAPEYNLARVRILLERGRVFQQSENIPQAQFYFEQAFELGTQHGFEYQAINAAHMIAIVVDNVKDKITWNQLAIQRAQNTKDKRASQWVGSLYNNLGQNYLEDKQFAKALVAFQKALEFRKKEGYAPNIRVAKWAIARTLRSLDRLDEALVIQHALVTEYDTIASSGSFDMPLEMFTLTRGWVYEELAELYSAKRNAVTAKEFADLAYADLAQNEMFRKTSPERLERLKVKKESDDCGG